MLSSCTAVIAGSTLRRAIAGSPCLEYGNVIEERSLWSAEKVFMQKILTDGNWDASEEAAMKLLIETAKALDSKFNKPVKED